MESQPQNIEFRNNPENFHPWRPDGGGSQVDKMPHCIAAKA